MAYETLPLPHTECYVFTDPQKVFDLVAWDRETKLYRLVSDDGTKRYLRYFEFCPISQAGEELIEAGDDGKLYTVQQLVDSQGHLAWKRPAWAENEAASAVIHNPWSSDDARRAAREALRDTASEPGASAPAPKRKAKGRPADAQGGAPVEPGLAGEAKAKVRELLAGCETREQVAQVGMVYLGEDAGALLSKYLHLDNGRFRMTIGNRMVGLYKKMGGFSKC